MGDMEISRNPMMLTQQYFSSMLLEFQLSMLPHHFMEVQSIPQFHKPAGYYKQVQCTEIDHQGAGEDCEQDGTESF
jgi:hypothetical protein